MKSTSIIIIGFIIIPTISCDEIDSESFPENLKLGAAVSAFQTEGAWNIDGKGESIWDRWTHQCPTCIADRNNVDITCDSYHKYKEDVALLKNIGFAHYRFSISWPRILPHGFSNEINYEGIEYYKNFTKELLDNGIEPIVTIYHFDHPQILEDMGGWTNQLMINWFVDYANIVFKYIGPYVKIFATINEPQKVCVGYSDQTMSPGKNLLGVGSYQCIHNILKAHARTYHLYDKEFRPSQRGEIGIVNSCTGYVLDEMSDAVTAERAFQFDCGIISHPIYHGDYPPVVKRRLALVSRTHGFSESRLPKLSRSWISYIKGTSDYFGLNHYESRMYFPDPDEALGIHDSDSGIRSTIKRSWINKTTIYVPVVPEGFGNLLRKIKEEYDNPPVYIMENGFPDDGRWRDLERMHYFYLYLKEMNLAIKRDGCRILKYTVWSLLDNFELSYGYKRRFGLISVDFNSTDRHRTPKLSAFWWKNVIETRKLWRVAD